MEIINHNTNTGYCLIINISIKHQMFKTSNPQSMDINNFRNVYYYLGSRYLSQYYRFKYYIRVYCI